jgi:hypothetical protein
VSSESAGNLGSCGSPRLITTFCNRRSHSTAQTPQIFRYDIFCDDAATGTDDRRQPYDVIAAARANVSDDHPGFDPEQAHELAWFAGIVALLFVVPDWADDVCDRVSLSQT